MHELGIAQSALEQVLAAAATAGATRVLRVTLRVGEFSGVDPEALRFGFEVVRTDTAAAEAELEIDRVAAVAHCNDCDADFAPETAPPFACPRCGRWSGTLVHGRELELVRIETL